MLPLAAMLAELRSLASADTAQPLRVGQLDNVPLDASSSFGEIFANKIVLKCPRNAIGLKSQIESCFQFIESNVENRFVDPCNYRFSPSLRIATMVFDIGTSRLSAGRLANRDSHVIHEPNSFCLRLQLLNGPDDDQTACSELIWFPGALL